MAGDKSNKQLKKELTIAKSLFTRQANVMEREATNMVQRELQEEFDKLSERFTVLTEASDNYLAAIMSDEAKEQETILHQQKDIEMTITDAEEKLKINKAIVQKVLWSKYGEKAVQSSIRDAEDIAERTNEIPIQGGNLDSYGVHMDILEKALKGAAETMLIWERWSPGDERVTVRQDRQNEDCKTQTRAEEGQLRSRKTS
ncbi:unnamed protein product [Knipowitschia caucasica]